MGCKSLKPPCCNSLKNFGDIQLCSLTLNFQVCLAALLSSAFFSAKGIGLPGCKAMSAMSRTSLWRELEVAGLRGSMGGACPSCSSIPLLVIRQSWDLLPASCKHSFNQNTLKFLNILTSEKNAVIILKFEQCGATTE